jgi:hypothetical protein
VRRALAIRSLALLTLAGTVAVAAGSAASPALAQKEVAQPTVTLRLVSQDAWNSVDRPLQLAFDATNESDLPIDGLSVELIVQAPVTSRSQYELSATEDATVTLYGYPFLQEGTLQPGETRRFTIEQDVSLLAARQDNGLYPLKVELRSHDVAMAAIRTPMVFLFETPQIPLNLAWTWVLAEPVQYRPDGTFLPGSIEADIARGGRLRSMAIALSRMRHHQVDVVVSPSLLDQLTRMAGGYQILDDAGRVRTVAEGEGGAADAASMLQLLQEVAGQDATELVATPLGDPDMPAMVRANLSADLEGLVDRGTTAVASALGRTPTADILRPPASRLDAATLDELSGNGIRTVLLDPNFVRYEHFEAPDVIRLTSASSAVAAVLPDPDINRLMQSNPDDPRLAAQVTLGALAANWLEFPGTPGRGAALMLPDRTSLPPAFFRPFAALVRHSRWLHTLSATGFVSIASERPDRAIPAHNYVGFPVTYLSDLLLAKAVIGQYRATVTDSEAKAKELGELLLVAEAGAFVQDTARGHAFIDRVEAEVRHSYDGLQIITSVVTLASQSGQFPLVLRNDSSHEMRVVLKLVADRRVSFEGGNTQTIMLAPGVKTLLLRANAQATGRIPVRVQLLTSGGGAGVDVIAERTMVIRSTAYNRVALFVTIGAALFLLGWWGRRFLPRRRRA